MQIVSVVRVIQQIQYYTMSGLENLLGGVPINQLPRNVLPTLRDVLLFYSSLWNNKCSDSLKEKMVAQALMSVYKETNIPISSELTIQNRIKRNIAQMKTILKFQRKSKTSDNVRIEGDFILRLEETFDVRRKTPSMEPRRHESGSGISSCLPIEANNEDFSNGIQYKKKFN